MTWEIVNTLGRLILTGMVIYKSTQFREMMNVLERVGLGLMGSGSFMTISVIWERQASPFDGWAGSLLTWGAVAFLIGRTWRDRRHSRLNAQAVKQARAHLQSKGKL